MGVYVKKTAAVPLEHPTHGGLMVPDPWHEYDDTDPLVVAHPDAFSDRAPSKPRPKRQAKSKR